LDSTSFLRYAQFCKMTVFRSLQLKFVHCMISLWHTCMYNKY
jgi:hypothetical protein